jgi:hypothetical protein
MENGLSPRFFSVQKHKTRKTKTDTQNQATRPVTVKTGRSLKPSQRIALAIRTRAAISQHNIAAKYSST